MKHIKESANALPDHLGIIGTGLIGVSLVLALKQRGLKLKVTGFDANRAHLQCAAEVAGFDALADSPQQAAAGGGVIVLATHPSAMREVFEQLGSLDAGAVVSDVGSVKRSIIRSAETALGDDCAQFVPSHPIAGTERSGPQAADAMLFEGCAAVVTPLPGNAASAVRVIADLWHRAGAAKVLEMTPEEHDRIFARSSHLPHALAYALMHSISDTLSAADMDLYSAGGLRGFARLAASDPDLWCDILLSNSDRIIPALQSFHDSSDSLRAMLERRDADGLRDLFRQVKCCCRRPDGGGE